MDSSTIIMCALTLVNRKTRTHRAGGGPWRSLNLRTGMIKGRGGEVRRRETGTRARQYETSTRAAGKSCRGNKATPPRPPRGTPGDHRHRVWAAFVHGADAVAIHAQFFVDEAAGPRAAPETSLKQAVVKLTGDAARDSYTTPSAEIEPPDNAEPPNTSSGACHMYTSRTLCV